MERIKNLYVLHKEAVYRYFLRMTGNGEEAGELTQETFYQACLSIYRFKKTASLKTWLFSIARNVYLKNLRQKGTHKVLLWGQEEFPNSVDMHIREGSLPDQALILKEDKERIRKALFRLSENDRTIIILKEYEQLSYEEIAGVFDQSVNWARVTFFRAKKRLKQFYEELESVNR